MFAADNREGDVWMRTEGAVRDGLHLHPLQPDPKPQPQRSARQPLPPHVYRR